MSVLGRGFRPIEVLTTHGQRQRAMSRAAEFEEQQLRDRDRAHLPNSILDGKGTPVGNIGEIVIADYYNYNAASVTVFEQSPWPSARHHDFGSEVLNNTTHEQKTKSCTVPPAPNWNCSVFVDTPEQHCDFYWFARTLPDLGIVWILGFISKYDFFALQTSDTIGIKGEVDTSDGRGWRFRGTCFNVRADQLWMPPPRELLIPKLILPPRMELENATSRLCSPTQRRSQERVEAHALLPICG
jgi:hypothetical protein